MLVINRVELVLVNKPFKMRKLECDHPVRRKKMRHPRGKVVEIGDLRQNVIANNEIGLPPFGFQALRKLQAEEFNERWNIFLARNFSDISRWLDARNGDAKWEKMLKQISIVACNFENLAICAETKPILLSYCNTGARVPPKTWNMKKNMRIP